MPVASSQLLLLLGQEFFLLRLEQIKLLLEIGWQSGKARLQGRMQPVTRWHSSSERVDWQVIGCWQLRHVDRSDRTTRC